MTRLPWQHSRNRTKSGNDRPHLSNPQEWFSRHTSEPSRQALADLVKAHKRDESDESNGPRTRSRGSTITSVEWQRGRSRAGSTSDDAWSRPASPYHVREGSTYSIRDRSDGATRALLAKGGLMLRRTGSKMSMSSAGSSSTLGLTSPPRTTNNSVSEAATKNEELRGKISTPFDFQHVTHTDQRQFAGLGRIEETELADQFTHVVTRQSAAPGLRGIAASDIGTVEEHDLKVTTDSPYNDSNAPPRLPMTAYPPTPPPKDDVVEDHIIVGASSTKLANGPQQPSPLNPGISSETVLAAVEITLAQTDTSTPLHSARSLVSVNADDVDLNAKPLPELPAMQTEVPVIHAVTTEANIARAMISTPLPTPPGVSTTSEGGYFSQRPMHQRQKSSVALPRCSPLGPSSKSSMPNLLSANHLSVTPKTLARHHSDMALSQQAKNAQAPPRSCGSRMSFAAVDTMDWENAVDEAWDAVDDAYEADNSAIESSFSSFNSTLSATVDDVRLGASSPLNAAPNRPLPATPSQRASPSVVVEPQKLESVQEDEQQQPDLAGLGISSCPPSTPLPSVPNFSRSSSLHYAKNRGSMCFGTNEILTRSSSQESIILSIASSFIGTQRSSNSSVYTDDMLNLSGAREKRSSDSAAIGQVDQMEKERSALKARPESGCLPTDVIEQLSKVSVNPNAEEAAEAKDDVPPVPAVPQHKYSKSSSRVTVPERRSSAASSSRKRSNTTGARPRQSTRISYSLFPNATPTPPVSS
ncbi:hypothetical protein OHC33_005078 [Knufia fluminis]|uniref:CRIB domain-containing protein n=1 Tax=Knufia fluminis TaxID=191047 RepID=A0AAN8I5Z6_9EURO|nr:hypothetical protein OHC33_005078 [Knufia fluminis]